MFFYSYLLLVTYYFLKPARDSLLLVELGVKQLPFVFILIALVVVPVTTLYFRASRSLKLNRLINATVLVLIVNLILLRWLLQFSQPWIFYVFYVWVSIFGALSTSQFWLYANVIFDATQAKRLFVFFGLGAIIGAFTGGEVTRLLIRVYNVPTENLLFFCMGFLAVCMVLISSVWAIKQRRDTEPVRLPRAKAREAGSYADTFRMIKSSRHLMLIVGVIAMTMATASFVDFQFKTVAVNAFPTKQELTSFFGGFYGRLSLISFLFQFLISYRLLRWLGVGGVIFFLPLGLFGGSLAMLFFPGLLAGVLIRGTDGVFRYSIDKTARELLFLPVPLEVKKRTKIFIDMFVDRWFRGFAGLALLLFVSVLDFSVRQLSIVVMFMLAIWFFLAFLVRKEYVNAFRKALMRREIDPGELRINIAEASTLRALRDAVTSDNERDIEYALDMLSGVKDAAITNAVTPLLRHESDDIRLKTIRVLQTQGGDFRSELTPLLHDDNPLVQRAAMRYLCGFGKGDNLEMLNAFLGDPNPRIQAAALSCAAEFATLEAAELITDEVVKRLLAFQGDDGEFVRSQVAEALGVLGSPAFRSHILELMDDPSPKVVASAIQSAGRTGDREFVPHLINRFSDKRYRRHIRDALAAYGDRIVGTLRDYIIDASFPIAIRSRLCRVLSHVPTQNSVDTLASALDDVESEVRYHVIKALNTLHTRYAELRFEHDSLNNALLDETRSYYTILQILHVGPYPDTPAGLLLVKALEEKTDQNLERIFRLLGLRHPASDIYSAYLGIISTKKDIRASAVEFLDNILKKDIKKYLFPIMDTIPVDAKVKRGTELFGVSMADVNESLTQLIEGHDPWLKACAIYSLTKDSTPELRALVEKSTDDLHPVVRQTARLVAARLAARPGEMGGTGGTSGTGGTAGSA